MICMIDDTQIEVVEGGSESDTAVQKIDDRGQHGMLEVNDQSKEVCMNSDDQVVQSMNTDDKYERDDECEVLSTVVCTHSKKYVSTCRRGEGSRVPLAPEVSRVS